MPSLKTNVTNLMRFAPNFCLISILSGALVAHDLYILPDAFYVTANSTLQIGIHNGDAFPQSEAAAVIARLRDAQLRDGKTVVSVLGLRVLGKRVVGAVKVPSGAGNMLLSVYTVPNLIQLPPDKFLEYLKEEGLTQVIGWRSKHGEANSPGRERYSKYAKSLVLSGSASDTYRQMLGFPIEIIPEKNPYELHAGSELPVRVMFRGKPAAGLQLEAAWFAGGKGKTVVIGRTNAEGLISVPLEAAGKWRLHSLMMIRCSDPKAADWESHWASLTFEVR